MTPSSGSFGWLKPRYEITEDRVVIARNVWLPFVLLALAGPGVWFLTKAFAHDDLDGGMLCLGLAGLASGLFALVMTPWLTPGRIMVTRYALVWGGRTFPKEDVKGIQAGSVELRSNRGSYCTWSLSIALEDEKLILLLGNHGTRETSNPLEAIEGAMRGTLGLK